MSKELEFRLSEEFITLGQLMKAMDFVGSGAEVKEFLQTGGFHVNGELDNRRGRKLRSGDRVTMPDGQVIDVH